MQTPFSYNDTMMEIKSICWVLISTGVWWLAVLVCCWCSRPSTNRCVLRPAIYSAFEKSMFVGIFFIQCLYQWDQVNGFMVGVACLRSMDLWSSTFGLSLLLSQLRQNKGTRSLALTSVVQHVDSNILSPLHCGLFSLPTNDPQRS